MKIITFLIAFLGVFILANAQISSPKTMDLDDKYSSFYGADVTLTDSAETVTYYYYVDSPEEYKCDVTVKTDTVLGDGSMSWKLYTNTLQSITGGTTLATVTTSGAVDTTFIIFSGTTTRTGTYDTLVTSVTIDLALRKRFLILQGTLTSDNDALVDFVQVDLTEYCKE